MSANNSQDRISRLAAASLPPLLFVSLLGLTFSTRANWRIPPPLSTAGLHLKVPDEARVLGSIETKLDAEAGSYLLISGWAVATAPGQRLTAVEFYVDGRLTERVTAFHPRGDVAAAYARPDFELSGWRCVLPTRDLKPGQYELDVQGVTVDGTSTSLAKKPLSILK